MRALLCRLLRLLALRGDFLPQGIQRALQGGAFLSPARLIAAQGFDAVLHLGKLQPLLRHLVAQAVGLIARAMPHGDILGFAPPLVTTKEEVDEVKKTRDPIDHIKVLLADAKATEDEIKAIDAEIKAIVAEAVQFAQESPEPDPSELYTDVYMETAQ